MNLTRRTVRGHDEMVYYVKFVELTDISLPVNSFEKIWIRVYDCIQGKTPKKGTPIISETKGLMIGKKSYKINEYFTEGFDFTKNFYFSLCGIADKKVITEVGGFFLDYATLTSHYKKVGKEIKFKVDSKKSKKNSVGHLTLQFGDYDEFLKKLVDKRTQEIAKLKKGEFSHVTFRNRKSENHVAEDATNWCNEHALKIEWIRIISFRFPDPSTVVVFFQKSK